MTPFIKTTCLLILSIALGQNTHAQTLPPRDKEGNASNDVVIQRIFLVGDGGEMKEGHHPVCDWLKQHVNWNDTSNVLVYLGDNIYPKGMPPLGSSGREEAERILSYQLSVVKDKQAKAFIVPGNHDWKQGKEGGWDQVRNQSAFIDSLNLPNVQFLPADGCPGPVEVHIGEKTILVCMDSQWWLQRDERPGSRSGCDFRTEDEVINALKDIISSYPDKLIVLAMHHPLYTYGEHGGYYTIRQHLFPFTDLDPGLYIPLPLIGSIYPLVRGVFGNIQDTRNPRYKDFRQRVEEVIKGHPNVVHAAGHEHTLQLLLHDSVYYIVSGAGAKSTRIRMGKYSLFARREQGFSVIELTAGGKATIKFYTLAASGLDEAAYTAMLPALPAPLRDTLTQVRSFPDSVTVVPAPYFTAGGFKRLMLGKNYRKEWATPVRMKVFDMSGWTPLRRGGGTQTRSLRLVGKDGREFVFRSVEKFETDAALPEGFQGTFVKDLVQDGVSASYPFAALSIPPIATAAGVPHATPGLFYMPDDPRLGRFRSDYRNMPGLFEEREPGGDGKKTYNTDDMDKKMQQDNDNRIDQGKVLQARLLDMFFMDFDRHEEQWRWAVVDNGKGKTFSPVPKDRDQPFFINSGILPAIVGSSFISPQLQGFRAKARNINTFNYNNRFFDHNYLTALPEKDWQEGASAILALMTDSLIDHSLALQPREIQPYSTGTIIATLKERRKYYAGEMQQYYKFLARTVSVYGSDKRELFDVLRSEDGTVLVSVYKLNKEGEAKQMLFERKFIPGETKEIRLYGLGGDDRFYIHGNGGGPIVVRLIGGPGNDQFDNQSGAPAGKTRIYDLKTEGNQLTGSGRYRSFLSSDPAVNAVNRRDFRYNVLTPLLAFSYNSDDGVFLGASARYTNQGFHKEPYKQLHELSVTHSLATKAYNFRYYFEATQAIGKLDLLLDANVHAPNNTINFFRYGNESVFDKSGGKKISYYRTRFNLYDLSLQLRKKLGSVLTIAAGPAFQYFTMDSADNRGRFIDRPAQNGLDSATLFASKGYLGGRIVVSVDDRNHKTIPTRGINWQTRFGSYGGVNHASRNYSSFNSDLALYTSFSRQAGFVIATRAGYGKVFGPYEFYQAQYLGQEDYLRGYRKYRFSGDELFYHNLDLRIKIADFSTYLLPGSWGIQLFNDIGRVWLKGENSGQWHDGYGAGLWVSPLKRFVATASYARGTDGGMLLVTWGFQY